VVEDFSCQDHEVLMKFLEDAVVGFNVVLVVGTTFVELL